MGMIAAGKWLSRNAIAHQEKRGINVLTGDKTAQIRFIYETDLKNRSKYGIIQM